jgi:hypothetical protein
LKDCLEKFQQNNLFLHPFPHIVINDALTIDDNASLVQELQYAESVALTKIDDQDIKSRYTITSQASAKNKNLTAFNAFNEAHSGREFGKKVLAIFEPYLKENLPNISIESVKKFSNAESAFMVNNPPISSSYTPRGPHLDNRKDIFAFLYYLCPDNHVVKGGNLQLFKYKDHFRGFDRMSRVDQGYLPSDTIELFKEVPYKNNTLVVLLNGINSVHGVQPLELNSLSRFYFTGGCQFNRDTYNPNSYLSVRDFIKDKTGEIYQKTLIKLFGYKPYGN